MPSVCKNVGRLSMFLKWINRNHEEQPQDSDSYFTALGDAATNFDGTLTGAIDTYYNTMLNAQITRSDSHFDALHDRYDAMEGAIFDYEQAAFDAAEEAGIDYVEAAIEAAVDNAEYEMIRKETEKDYYEGVALQQELALDYVMSLSPSVGGTAMMMQLRPKLTMEELQAIRDYLNGTIFSLPQYLLAIVNHLGGIFNNTVPASFASVADWSVGVKSVAMDVSATHTTVNNQKGARASQVTIDINAVKTTNENIRIAKDAQTKTKYINAESAAWNTYYATVLAAENTYFTAYSQIETTFNNTKKLADSAYDASVIPAWCDYVERLDELDSLFTAAVAHAGDANFIVANWFNNGGSIGIQDDYQLVTMQTVRGQESAQGGGGSQNTHQDDSHQMTHTDRIFRDCSIKMGELL